MVPQTMRLRDTWPTAVPVRMELRDVPFYPQQEYQCGPAALATVLANTGATVAPEELVAQVYLPARKGSLQIEMLTAPRHYGRVSYPLAPRFDHLLREIAAGNPVIVLQDIGIGPITRWHYAVVVGFDYPAGELYFRSGEKKRLAIPFTIFEYSWKQSNYWAMVALPPDRIPATANEIDYLAAISAMARVSEVNATLTAYSTFLERWPDNLTASISLANQHYALGNLKETKRVLEDTYVRHPKSVVVLNNLAQTLSDLGQNDEALVLIEQADKQGANPFAETVHETHTLILQRLDKHP